MSFTKIIKDRNDFVPLWKSLYFENPYLSNLSIEELDVRASAFCKNLSYLYRIIPKNFNAPHGFSLFMLIMKIEDIRTEYKNRNTIFPYDYDEILLSTDNTDTILLNNQFFYFTNRSKIFYPLKVFRFTKAKYAEEFSLGNFRLTNSTIYKKLENKAQHDCETEKNSYRLGSKVKITNLSTNTPINPIGDVKFTSCAPNYYLLSLSSDLDLKLANDFEADSVIVIKNFNIFLNELDKELYSSFYIHAQPCHYYDCYYEKPHDAIFSKDISYAYQREIRICAIPKKNDNLGEYLPIKIHSLSKLIDIYKIQHDGKITSFY